MYILGKRDIKLQNTKNALKEKKWNNRRKKKKTKEKNEEKESPL